MNKLYKQSYFNPTAWILDNFEKLNINNDELVFILLVEYAKENNIKLSYDYFISKLKMEKSDIDKIITSLITKQYLKITADNKGINYDIDNLFEFDVEAYQISENRDIYDTLNDVFGRPLNTTELQKASDLIEEFGQNQFNDALRTAEAYRKVNMNYIESILRNNENK